MDCHAMIVKRKRNYRFISSPYLWLAKARVNILCRFLSECAIKAIMPTFTSMSGYWAVNATSEHVRFNPILPGPCHVRCKHLTVTQCQESVNKGHTNKHVSDNIILLQALLIQFYSHLQPGTSHGITSNLSLDVNAFLTGTKSLLFCCNPVKRSSWQQLINLDLLYPPAGLCPFVT